MSLNLVHVNFLFNHNIKVLQDAFLVLQLNASSCVLWSLAALDTKNLSFNFYVPGLLPQQSIVTAKKELKIPKVGVGKESTKSAVQMIEPGDSSVQDKRMSEPPVPEKEVASSLCHFEEQFTASQMANVEMLAELACSGSSGSDAVATQRFASPRESDDGEVFPSSGFCMPLLPEVELKEVQ